MNLADLVQQYPAIAPLLELKGTPDFSNFFGRWLNIYPSVKEIIEILTNAVPR